MFKEALKILVPLLLIIAFSQWHYTISWSELSIPLTGQSLIILVVAVLWKPSIAIKAIGLYLVLGGIGLPVFAEATGGWKVFIGNTGGYLIGFLLAGMVCSYLAVKWGRTNLFLNLVLMSIGTLIILLSGTLRLMTIYGIEKGVDYGFYPFIAGAIVKVILGALIVTLISQYVSKENSFIPHS